MALIERIGEVLRIMLVAFEIMDKNPKISPEELYSKLISEYSNLK